MSDTFVDPHSPIPVSELTAEAINNIGFGPYPGKYQTVAEFLSMEGPDRIKNQAAEEYVSHLKHIAEKFHADSVDLMGLGGEAMIFNLHRNNQDLNAVIRMEAGYMHTGMDDVEEDSRGNEIHPSSPGPFIEEFSPADKYMPGILPHYYRDITTTEHDIAQRGVMFKVSPFIYTAQDIEEVHNVTPQELGRMITTLHRRQKVGRVDTTELLEPNIGFYPIAAPTAENPNAFKLHAVSFDPGNMQHGHNYPELRKSEKRQVVEWPLKYPALFANGEQAEERMRQEITADADRLMNGEDSELTKRIRSIQGAELSDGWARMVSDARRDGIKRG